MDKFNIYYEKFSLSRESNKFKLFKAYLKRAERLVKRLLKLGHTKDSINTQLGHHKTNEETPLPYKVTPHNIPPTVQESTGQSIPEELVNQLGDCFAMIAALQEQLPSAEKSSAQTLINQSDTLTGINPFVSSASYTHQDIIDALDEQEFEQPLLIIGEAGIGKTVSTRAYAKKTAQKLGRTYIQLKYGSLLEDEQGLQSKKHAATSFDRTTDSVEGQDTETLDGTNMVSVYDIYADPSKYYLCLEARPSEMHPLMFSGVPGTAKFNGGTGYTKLSGAMAKHAEQPLKTAQKAAKSTSVKARSAGESIDNAVKETTAEFFEQCVNLLPGGNDLISMMGGAGTSSQGGDFKDIRGVFFIDEINRADDKLFFNLIMPWTEYDNVIGKEQWKMIAAGNPSDYSGTLSLTDFAHIRRFIIVDLIFDPDYWLDNVATLKRSSNDPSLDEALVHDHIVRFIKDSDVQPYAKTINDGTHVVVDPKMAKEELSGTPQYGQPETKNGAPIVFKDFKLDSDRTQMVTLSRGDDDAPVRSIDDGYYGKIYAVLEAGGKAGQDPSLLTPSHIENFSKNYSQLLRGLYAKVHELTALDSNNQPVHNSKYQHTEFNKYLSETFMKKWRTLAIHLGGKVSGLWADSFSEYWTNKIKPTLIDLHAPEQWEPQQGVNKYKKILKDILKVKDPNMQIANSFNNPNWVQVLAQTQFNNSNIVEMLRTLGAYVDETTTKGVDTQSAENITSMRADELSGVITSNLALVATSLSDVETNISDINAARLNDIKDVLVRCVVGGYIILHLQPLLIARLILGDSDPLTINKLDAAKEICTVLELYGREWTGTLFDKWGGIYSNDIKNDIQNTMRLEDPNDPVHAKSEYYKLALQIFTPQQIDEFKLTEYPIIAPLAIGYYLAQICGYMGNALYCNPVDASEVTKYHEIIATLHQVLEERSPGISDQGPQTL
jgi:hypothetical protein